MILSLAFEISLITINYNPNPNPNFPIPKSPLLQATIYKWINPASFQSPYILCQQMDEEDYNYDDYNNQDPVEEPEPQQEEVPGSYDHPSYSQEEQIGEEQDYEILPLIKLFAELNLILDEVNKLVYLDKGWCLILLKDFKWDHEILRQQYYNRNEFYLNRAGFKPGLNHPGCFNRGVIGMCEVCCNEDVPLYYNICDHNFCIDCWMYHLKTCIQGGSAFPKCMDSDCPCPILLETMILVFKEYGEEGDHWMKKFEKKLCQLFITTNRNYQFCTGVDCGNCIKVNTQLDTVVCNCGKIFCFRCQSDDHYPCKCQEKAKWIQQVVKEEADAKWISQNAKICPWCKKAVERSMGCNFMACTCGKSFCYMCSQPWQPDHKDHFKCHIFKKKPDDIVNREKEVMERMNHCTERYIFNQAVANNYKEIDVFSKRKYLFKTLHIDLTDSEFMENAYKFAIECCEKLKWIYAFTYFHDLKYRKDSFEFSLGEYERYKENLLKLLASDLKKFVTNVEEIGKEGPMDESVVELMTAQFKNLKKQIVNYYTCTKNFKEKFVQELQQITEEMDAEKDKEEMQSYYKENPNLLLKTSKSKEEMVVEKQEKRGLINTIFGGNKKAKKKK